MVLLGIDGRRNDGAVLSKDKLARRAGTEPLDYGSTTGEDLLNQSSDSLSGKGFKESALRVVSYFKVASIKVGGKYPQIVSISYFILFYKSFCIAFKYINSHL